MQLPECCANCESFPKALKDPEYGWRLKSVWVKNKNKKHWWEDDYVLADMNDPENRVGGCQTVWEGNRKYDKNRQFTQMSCRYYSTPKHFDMFIRFEGSPEKEKLKMRLKFDKMREKNE